MARPFLSDTGQKLELDLHGATIDEAIRLVQKTITLGHEYGRSSLKIIHGSSTSGSNLPTIKTTLHQILESGQWTAIIQSSHLMEDYMILGFSLGKSTNPRRLSTPDIW